MRRGFRFTWWILAFGLIYLATIFYSRWSVNQALIHQLQERKASQDRAIVKAHGGSNLTILSFYAWPPAIRRGDTAQLCYSVSNSKSVRIEPPVKNVWPSLSRCVDVDPTDSTVYTLIAQDAKGNTLTAHTTVKVE